MRSQNQMPSFVLFYEHVFGLEPDKRLAFAGSLHRDECFAFALVSMNNENDQANRAISTGKLHTLLRFHTRPIDVVVFHGSQGILVFRWVSRLDAFSGYPVRT